MSKVSKWQELANQTLRLDSLPNHCRPFQQKAAAQVSLLYLPTQICFLIGREQVICSWSELSDSLGKQHLKFFCTLKLLQICVPTGRHQANVFFLQFVEVLSWEV